jgi:hypothetical protein
MQGGTRSMNYGPRSIERPKSNQQELLKQMEPHRRLGGGFVRAIGM